MKFRWDKKYLYWGVTGLFVVIGGIIFYYLMFHSRNLKENLMWLFSIVTPIVDGLILAYLLWPVVHAIEHKLLYPLKDRLQNRFPYWRERQKQLHRYCRGISILVTLAIVFFLISGFFSVVIPQIASSIQTIVNQFPTYVNNLSLWLEEILADNPEIEKTVTSLFSTYSHDLEQWLNKTVLPQMNTILKTVSLSMLSALKALWNLVIGLIISVYLMGNKEKFTCQSKKMLFAFLDVKQANAFMEDVRLIDRTFGGFINGKILDSLIIGVLCFICVSLLKFPYPMLISVIVGVTNVIPFFGPYIGAIPSTLLILMVNPRQALYFVIFILILQQFDGNFLGPKILGGSTGLSGFWVIFSITLFSGLLGVAGMILGVPLFAVFYALVKRRIDRNLQKKGMPTETVAYHDLERVENKTGKFVRMQESSSPSRTKSAAKWSWTLKKEEPRREQQAEKQPVSEEAPQEATGGESAKGTNGAEK